MNPTETWNAVKTPLGKKTLTAPVSMSYMRAPKLHQSTALLWPLRIRISGALTWGGGKKAKDTIYWIFSLEAEEAQE